MRSLHARSYAERPLDKQGQTTECLRRGFVLTHNDTSFATRAVHLQEKLRVLPTAAPLPVGDKRAPLPPPVVSQPDRASVTWRQDKAYKFPDDAGQTGKKRKSVDLASPSSTSESWDSREQEIQNLLGANLGQKKSSRSVRDTLSVPTHRSRGGA